MEDNDNESHHDSSYEEYPQDQLRQTMERQKQQQEQKVKRAIWLTQYHEHNEDQKQWKKNCYAENNQENHEQNSYERTESFFQKSTYYNDISQKKNSWAYDFIDWNLRQAQITQNYSGVDVTFPYKPYDQQKLYIRQVIECLKLRQNGFLQSPTGTGKTLCMLTSALAWLYYQKKQNKRHYKIIYLSRTHTQLEQVQRELKRTIYRPTMAIMGSRKHFCINDKLDKQQLKEHQLRQQCSESRRAYYKLKKQGNIITDPDQLKQLKEKLCPHFVERYQTVKIGETQTYHNRRWESQQIKQQAKGCFCPYFYPLYMQDHCDLLMMPYNYLLDVRIFERYASMIRNSIVIFDEAHNVAEVSCSGRSFEVSLGSLSGFYSEIQALITNPPKFKADQQKLKSIRSAEMIKTLTEFGNQIFQLKDNFKAYFEKIPFEQAQLKDNKPKQTKLFHQQEEPKYKWSYVVSSQKVEFALMNMIFKLTDYKIEKYKQSKNYRKTLISTAIVYLQQIMSTKDEIVQAFTQIKGFSFHQIQHTSKFLKRIIYLLQTHEKQLQHYYRDQLKHYCLVLSVQFGSQFDQHGCRIISDFKLNLNCLVPWFTFAQIKKFKPYNFLLTSGTMKPIDEWKGQLNLQGRQFVNDHVIKSHQIRLNIISHNLNQDKFDFRFDQMKSEKDNRINKYRAMIEMIVSIIRQVPGGIVVIFPNYTYIKEIHGYLKYKFKDLNNKIQGQAINKRQFFEEKGSQNQINDYKEYTRSGKGAVLYVVCRGKASEGIDFPDNECRAVIFIGIPFPNAHNPIMLEKKLHYKKLQRFAGTIPELKGINWDNYYFNSTIRAINQGLGRVIRHSKDFGQLFMLDSRYLFPYGYNEKSKKYRDYLPKWAVGDYSQWGEDSGIMQAKIKGLKQFYQLNQKLVQ